MHATVTTAPAPRRLSRRQSVGLMLICTVLGAIGQVFIKDGAAALRGSDPWTTAAGIWANLWAMASSFYLIAGYTLYGIMTVIFVFALRDEELSIVYPIIALTYVWVAGLSFWLFHDSLNALKLVGVVAIVAGVAVLGRDGKK